MIQEEIENEELLAGMANNANDRALFRKLISCMEWKKRYGLNMKRFKGRIKKLYDKSKTISKSSNS